jgi:hypothetical protein
MNRWLVLSLAAIPLFLSAVRPAPPSLIWWTTDAMQKVRPYDSPPDKPIDSIRVEAARNEFEPFQIVFRAGTTDVDGLDVDVSDFEGPDHAILSKNNITPYFERFLDLPQPSSTEGAAGEWPDALIPRTDKFFGERRNAFPFSVASRRNQPIWFDVYVPPTTRPGIYRGHVFVFLKDKRDAAIPVTLQVWNFTLPSTSSLVNTFGLNGLTAIKQHYGRYTTDEEIARVTKLYRKSALWHRISINTGSMLPPRLQFSGDNLRVDWSSYDEEVGPFMDGTAIAPSEPLYGAMATSIDLTHIPSLEGQKKILYWHAVARHFRDKGWFDRLFNYLWDEPKADKFAELVKEGNLVHTADPAIRNLVTASYRSDWTPSVDIFTPLVNCFAFKPGRDRNCDQATQQPVMPNLWWYQSCASHGCNVVGGEYYKGWPTYMIDAPSVSNRVMPWLAWKYGIKGELYYSMNEAYSRKQDAWTNVYIYGGNGDGTLYYPGRPRTIGGRSDIPIESIRLKLIREGLEDYEYFVQLAQREGPDAVSRIVNEIAVNAYTYNRDPAKLRELRRQIGERLDAGPRR